LVDWIDSLVSVRLLFTQVVARDELGGSNVFETLNSRGLFHPRIRLDAVTTKRRAEPQGSVEVSPTQPHLMPPIPESSASEVRFV
jgi:hypothetical protein